MKPDSKKTYCCNCEKDTNHTIEFKEIETSPVEFLAKNEKESKTESFWMVGIHLWQISKCNGCDKLTFKHIIRTSQQTETDIIFYFPRNSIRPIPPWYRKLPLKYIEILNEIYSSINQGSYIVALIGIRTVLDMFIVDKIGDKGSFEAKLDELVIKGIITSSKAKTLNTAIDAGNASAHRGYKPEKEVLSKILDIVDNLLESEILDSEADIIKDKTPKRK